MPDLVSHRWYFQGIARTLRHMSRSNFSMTRQFGSFCLLGAVGTLAHWAVLVAGVKLGVLPVFSSAFGFIVGAIMNYVLGYYYIFHSESPHPQAIAKFFTIAAIGVGFNSLVLSFAIYGLRLHYLVGQAVATGVVVVWNFFGNRWWTFR